MSPLRLFRQLLRGELFHYGNNPDRELVKVDHSHQVGPGGNIRKTDPDVLVFSDRTDSPTSIFTIDESKGDSDV